MIVSFSDGQTIDGVAQLRSDTAKFTFRDEGRAIAGDYISDGTFITRVIAKNLVLLNQPMVGSYTGGNFHIHRHHNAVTFAGSLTGGSVHVDVADGGLWPEDEKMWVTGTGIPDDTYVVSQTGNALILSNPATADGLQTLTINRYELPVYAEADKLRDHILDLGRDKNRQASRLAGAMTNDDVTDFIDRLKNLYDDYNLSAHKPILTVDMKTAPAPLGSHLTKKSSLVSAGWTFTGDHY